MITDGRSYRLKSITYCVRANATRYVDNVKVWASGGLVSEDDATNRNADGCYSFDWNGSYHDGYGAVFTIAGTSSALNFDSMRTTWELQPFIFVPPVLPIFPTLADPDNSSLSEEAAADGG